MIGITSELSRTMSGDGGGASAVRRSVTVLTVYHVVLRLSSPGL